MAVSVNFFDDFKLLRQGAEVIFWVHAMDISKLNTSKANGSFQMIFKR
jgi:hypothetical protein